MSSNTHRISLDYIEILQIYVIDHIPYRFSKTGYLTAKGLVGS
jgi:hypothetical protein